MGGYYRTGEILCVGVLGNLITHSCVGGSESHPTGNMTAIIGLSVVDLRVEEVMVEVGNVS